MSTHYNNDYINSPFKFLDAYELKDNKVFFGRKKETDELHEMVYKTKLMLIYGESGTGKTSLIQCGLASRFEGPDWLPFYIRRRGNINTSLHNTLDAYLKKENEKKGELIEKVAKLNTQYFRPVYLIFDQFEELFILGKRKEKDDFIQQIKQLIDAKLVCKVLFVMREEYIGHLYEFEKIIPALFDYRLRVEQMNRADVTEVVKQSFKEFNIHIEPNDTNLVDNLIDNISGKESRIHLPYLQIYLDSLYRAHYKEAYKDLKYLVLPPITLNPKIIKKLGTINDILENFLLKSRDNLQVKLSSKYSALSSSFVHDLLNEFVTDEGTKRPIKYKIENKKIHLDQRIRNIFSDTPEAAFTETIKTLKENRIIRDNDYILELAHDSLAKLIEEQRTDEQKIRNSVFQKLRTTQLLYDKTGEFLSSEDLILIKKNLASAQIEDFADFIKQSKAHHKAIRLQEKHQEREKIEKEEQLKRKELEAEEAEKRSQLEAAKNVQLKKKSGKIRKLAVSTSIFAGIATFLAFLAFTSFNQAQENFKEAKAQEKIATQKKEFADSVSIRLAEANIINTIKTAENFKYRGLYEQALISLDSLKSITIADTTVALPQIIASYKKNWTNLYNQIELAEKAKTKPVTAYNHYISAYQADTLEPYLSNIAINDSLAAIVKKQIVKEKSDWLKEKISITQNDIIRKIEKRIRQASTWSSNCECELSQKAIHEAKWLQSKLKTEHIKPQDETVLKAITKDVRKFDRKVKECHANCD